MIADDEYNELVEIFKAAKPVSVQDLLGESILATDWLSQQLNGKRASFVLIMLGTDEEEDHFFRVSSNQLVEHWEETLTTTLEYVKNNKDKITFVRTSSRNVH